MQADYSEAFQSNLDDDAERSLEREDAHGDFLYEQARDEAYLLECSRRAFADRVAGEVFNALFEQLDERHISDADFATTKAHELAKEISLAARSRVLAAWGLR